MASPTSLERVRVGWWAATEATDPLAALRGLLLRSEIRSRCQGFAPVLVYETAVSYAGPGFTGEVVAPCGVADLAVGWPSGIDLLVASGDPGPNGPKVARALAESGAPTIAVAPEPSWGLEPDHANVGPPFAVPEPALLAARHIPASTLRARGAYLRVVEGLPQHYVLVEGGLPGSADGTVPERADLARALAQLVARVGRQGPAEVVELAPAPLMSADPSLVAVLRERRAEAEEGRHLAEDWPGNPDRARLPLRVANPVDLAAAVAGAGAVVAHSGALMALAWALGVPHVALAAEGSPASDFAAWTGDASALAQSPSELLATMDNIFARGGRPPGLKRLEATLDQALDQAGSDLGEMAGKVQAGLSEGQDRGPAGQARLQELEVVNEALRQRLAAERLRFGERAALIEKAAHTTVESAIKAVQGQDVIIRRRLEQAEREMKRLQDETALQQAELRAIYATRTMRALVPARDFYVRLKKAAR